MNVATYIKYIAIPQPKSDINSQHIPERILLWLHNNRNSYYTNSIFSPPYGHTVDVYIFFLTFSSIIHFLAQRVLEGSYYATREQSS
jgi:hypothetical protein